MFSLCDALAFIHSFLLLSAALARDSLPHFFFSNFVIVLQKPDDVCATGGAAHAKPGQRGNDRGAYKQAWEKYNTQWCEIMVTASAKLLFSALLDSGSRSSLTISQTQCSLTSSLSFSHLKTVRAKTSSAHADSACLR